MKRIDDLVLDKEVVSKRINDAEQVNKNLEEQLKEVVKKNDERYDELLFKYENRMRKFEIVNESRFMKLENLIKAGEIIRLKTENGCSEPNEKPLRPEASLLSSIDQKSPVGTVGTSFGIDAAKPIFTFGAQSSNCSPNLFTQYNTEPFAVTPVTKSSVDARPMFFNTDTKPFAFIAPTKSNEAQPSISNSPFPKSKSDAKPLLVNAPVIKKRWVYFT
jgi:hypothetical protein